MIPDTTETVLAYTGPSVRRFLRDAEAERARLLAEIESAHRRTARATELDKRLTDLELAAGRRLLAAVARTRPPALDTHRAADEPG